MEAPKVMTEYPKKKTIRWIDDETGEECGSAEYIRIDAPEIVELVEALHLLLDYINKAKSPDITVRLKDFREAIDKSKRSLVAWEALVNE